MLAVIVLMAIISFAACYIAIVATKDNKAEGAVLTNMAGDTMLTATDMSYYTTADSLFEFEAGEYEQIKLTYHMGKNTYQSTVIISVDVMKTMSICEGNISIEKHCKHQQRLFINGSTMLRIAQNRAGAYEFYLTVWDNIERRIYPEQEGILVAAVSERDQQRRRLWNEICPETFNKYMVWAQVWAYSPGNQDSPEHIIEEVQKCQNICDLMEDLQAIAA